MLAILGAESQGSSQFGDILNNLLDKNDLPTINVDGYHPPSVNSLTNGNKEPKDDQDITGGSAAALSVLVRDHLHATPIPNLFINNDTFESCAVCVESRGTKCSITKIYRPPETSVALVWV